MPIHSKPRYKIFIMLAVFVVNISVITLLSGCTVPNVEIRKKLHNEKLVGNKKSPYKDETINFSKKIERKKLSSCISSTDKFNLLVNAPANSRIRILNSDKKYIDCMLLKKGRYKIEVTMNGFDKYEELINLESSKVINIELQKREQLIKWKKKNLNDRYKKFNPIISQDKIILTNNLLLEKGRRKLNYYEAFKYCNKLEIDGISGWRLPDKKNNDFNAINWKNELGRDYGFWDSNKHDAKGHKVKFRGVMKRNYFSKAHPSNSYLVKCVKERGKLYRNNLNINDLADIVYKEYLESKLNKTLPVKPLKGEYLDRKNLIQGEFETTKDFNKRESSEKIRNDRKNKKLNEKYKISLRQFNEKVKKIKEKNKAILKDIKKNKDIHYSLAIENAIYIKYGFPIIKTARYNADKQVFNIGITSQRGGYSQVVEVPVNIKYAKKFKLILLEKGFTPQIEFNLDNKVLIFTGINQIKDPKILVMKSEYNKAFNSISKLEKFLKKFPNSSLSNKANLRIIYIKYKGAYDDIDKLEKFINEYPQSKFMQEAKLKIKVLQEQSEERRARAIIREEKERTYRVAQAQRAKEREKKWQEREQRKSNSFSARKRIGDKVCKDYSALFISGTLEGYVERISSNKIQIRISESSSFHNNDYPYNGLIWESYSTWRHCSY